MILWLFFIFPFKDKLISWTYISSEFGFFIYTLALYTFVSESIENNTRLFYGRIILWMLFILIFINWLLFIVYMVNLFRSKRKLKKIKELAIQLKNDKEKLDRSCKKRKIIRKKSLSKKKIEEKREEEIKDEGDCWCIETS